MWLTSSDHLDHLQGKEPSSLRPFILLLDRPDRQYLVGEQLCGRIRFESNYFVPKDLRRSSPMNPLIKIQFYGEARISSGIFSSISSKHSWNSKHYHEIVITEIVSFKDNTNRIRRPMELPFMFHIPHHLPGSLDNGPHCYIKYQLVAQISQHQKDQMDIIIHSNSNTPYNRLCEPVIMSCNRNVGWIYSKMIRIRCELPRSGFEVGTEIPIKCMIDNRSTRSMSLEIKLIQKILMRKSHGRRVIQRHRNELFNKFVTDIEPYCIVQHITTMPLAANIPIVHNTSKLIQINYQVHVELKIPWHSNLRCKLPVILMARKSSQI